MLNRRKAVNISDLKEKQVYFLREPVQKASVIYMSGVCFHNLKPYLTL